jgi:hypothetical protein
MYAYVWSYVVRPEYVGSFRAAYGPKGEWVQLFRRDREYLRTDLLSNHGDPTRFMTIDFWSSREAFQSFRVRYSDEFNALDDRLAELTVEELHLGDFDVVSTCED